MMISKEFPVVGADIGCSHIKLTWYNEDNELQNFVAPSVIYEALAPVCFMEDQPNVNYECAGRTFNFHESCGVQPFNTKQPSFPYSIENVVMLHHALLNAGIKGDVKVAICMPYDDYFTDKGKNEKNIDKRKQAALETVTNDIDIDLHITDVQVFPEAIIGAYGCFIDDKGDEIQQIQQGLLAVDLGGRTSDLVHITSHWMPSRTGRKSTNAFGFLDVLDNLNNRIHDKGFNGVSPTLLNKAIEEGVIYKGNNRIEITEEIKLAKQSVLTRIKTAVDSWLMDGITIDNVLIFGGTAEAFRDDLEGIESAFIADNPQFANARACAIVGNL